MFDEVYCDYPMPEGYERFQGCAFQTKDLTDSLTEHRITGDGRLLRDAGRRVWVDEPGLKFGGGYLKRVTDDWEDTNHHGDVFLCDFDPDHAPGDGPLFDFRARFTNGRLADLRLERVS